jgi:hypothetical protein
MEVNSEHYHSNSENWAGTVVTHEVLTQLKPVLIIVVSIWREERRNKVCSGHPVFQQCSQKRKSLGCKILSEPNKLQNEPKKIAELIISNLHNIAMQHPTGSSMHGILDLEEKRKEGAGYH